MESEVKELRVVSPIIPLEDEIVPEAVVTEQIVPETVAVSEIEIVTSSAINNSAAPPAFSVPSVLLGCDINNPLTEDSNSGKKMPKPRLGVKVPYRNLTSQIVSQDEIAQELLERSLKNHPYTNPTEYRDIFFAKKLTHRLASRITSPSSPSAITGSMASKLVYSTETFKPDKSIPIKDHGCRPLLKEDRKLTETAELLAILDDDVDLVDGANCNGIKSDQNQHTVIKPQQNAGSQSPKHVGTYTSRKPRKQRVEYIDTCHKIYLKSNPQLEKELALKQLQECSKRKLNRDALALQVVLETSPDKNGVEPKSVKNSSEHNNNQNNLTPKLLGTQKRKVGLETTPVIGMKRGRPSKKLVLTSDSIIADPSEITTKADAAGEAIDMSLGKDNKCVKTYANRKSHNSHVNGDEVALTNQELLNLEKKRPRKIIVKDVQGAKSLIKKSPKSITKQSPRAREPKRKVLKEIEKLLGDEGAINMLFSIEQQKSSTNETMKGFLPSARRKKKDLLLKTKLVKTAVLKLSSSPPHALGKSALRTSRQMKEPQSVENELPMRKPSVDSVRSLASPTPSKLFAFPSKVPAEASRIIRRHSSSSSYSSRSNSPRRISKDLEHPLSPIEVDSDVTTAIKRGRKPKVAFDSGVTVKVKNNLENGTKEKTSPPQKNIMVVKMKKLCSEVVKGKEIRINPAHVKSQIKRVVNKGGVKVTKKMGVAARVSKNSVVTAKGHNKCIKKPISSIKHVRKITPSSKVTKKIIPSIKDARRMGQSVKVIGIKKTVRGIGTKKVANPLADKHAKKMAKLLKNINSKKIVKSMKASSTKKVDTPVGARVTKVMKKLNNDVTGSKVLFSPDMSPVLKLHSYVAESASAHSIATAQPATIFGKRQLTSTVDNYAEVLQSLSESSKRKDPDRSNTVRQNVTYKEISLRRYDNFAQIILSPVSTKLKDALNTQVLWELTNALTQLKRDDSVRVVLVTSSGNNFCQGVDFHPLIQDTPERRKGAAMDLSLAIREFVKCLAGLNKTCVAGVNGAAVGLGVTMLPYFDLVLASDKATFHTPYARLGQVAEGGATLSLPHILGNPVTSDLLFGCRKLTASEAAHFGLVTRSLWPDRFHEELIPFTRNIATQSLQSTEATKALLRHSLRLKLDSALDAESHLLVQHWCSDECQNNFRACLREESLADSAPAPIVT